jgi:hypothetical protein
MKPKEVVFNSRQLLFKELFVGTLIYAVVLGFFNDYTSIVYTKSFSYIFYSAIILELLTYLTFLLKDKIIVWLKKRSGTIYKILIPFSIWLIIFLSKIVFIWVIDMIFKNNVNINGFFGILLIVLSVTIIHMLANNVFTKLGDNEY